jgi:hypothetical protein
MKPLTPMKSGTGMKLKVLKELDRQPLLSLLRVLKEQKTGKKESHR